MTAQNHALNISRLRTGRDWHPLEIVVALRVKGTSLERLSRLSGYHPKSLHTVSRRPWPMGEKIIADKIGIKAADIWPSRYEDDFSLDWRKRRRGIRNASGIRKSAISNGDDTPSTAARNVNAVDRPAA